MFVAVSFVSCSDDDDKAKNPMVGTWQEYKNTRYVFKKNGTYEYWRQTPGEYSSPYKLDEDWSGKYSYNPKSNTWSEHRNDGISFTYYIHILNEETFSYTDLKWGDTYTLKKIK